MFVAASAKDTCNHSGLSEHDNLWYQHMYATDITNKFCKVNKTTKYFNGLPHVIVSTRDFGIALAHVKIITHKEILGLDNF